MSDCVHNPILLTSVSLLLKNQKKGLEKRFSVHSQWQMAKRRRLKSPLHSSFRASFRDTSYFSRYISLMVSRSNCGRKATFL